MFITLEESAEILGISPATLRRWVKQKRIQKYTGRYNSKEVYNLVKTYLDIECQSCSKFWVSKKVTKPQRCIQCRSTKIRIINENRH